ncbi:alpha-amylase family glycosyl hydrolase [Dactylosporangium darangshiense]|uniref:Glycosyl hydrolase family 13 catalytic domain-containing protein n=1 Tax=Dactylosporangium darangshiense TaxID=579108 RepID=A0ABP8DU84_9ACTN
MTQPPTKPATARARRMPVENDWYQRAVFDEAVTQACFDSNDDDFVDLLGLVSKLDYLQWLGIDCIWLPPFYDSPRRDGGYNIRDFYTICAEFGTIDDFVTLFDEAHARGIRVIRKQHVAFAVGDLTDELTGDTRWPSIGLRPYQLTLPGYGSYWFRILPPKRRRGSADVR